MLLEPLKKLPLVRPIYHFLLAFLSALLYGFPSKRLYVIGVSGTKGKTTTLELMNAILEEARSTHSASSGQASSGQAGNPVNPAMAGHGAEKTALLSSITVKVGNDRRKNPTETTMPGRFFIQRFLSRAVRAGCTYALVEVTSEGVKFFRHRFINWNAAFLINLHPEHIEAHGSFQAYRDAKLSFLRYAVRRGARPFINREDRNAHYYLHALRDSKLVVYSRHDLPGSYFREAANPMQAVAPEREFVMTEFNKDNVAAAVVLAKHLGIAEAVALRAVRAFKGIPGRMEFVQKEPFAVVVDYAHTPESLELVYQALRNSKLQNLNSKLICVLGSAGGGRDKWKRPVLGKIAETYCDAMVITNEDPYDEDPKQIMQEIEKGARDNPRFDAKLSAMTWKIEDRREAIRTAIEVARKGDTVVVTGKGSEEWIHVAHRGKIPWSDTRTVREILGART